MRSGLSRVRVWACRPLLELRVLATTAVDAWRSGRRPWLGLSLAASTVAVDALLHLPAARPTIERWTSLRADLPVGEWVARLPGSVVVPTADLPLWLAALQLAVVVGLAELLFPRRLVVAVGALGHVLPTLAARTMIRLGPGNVIGLPRYLAAELDTGPSALTTALGGFLLLRSGGRRLVTLLGVALLLADRISPGLDGREHLIALLVGALAAAATTAWQRRGGSETSAVPALRGQWALGVLASVVVGLLVASSYHPVQASPLVAGSGIRAVELQDRTHLPIDLGRLPAGTWLATTAACERPSAPRRATVWRTPRFLCTAAGGAPVVLRYRVAGVGETQRIQLV